MRNINKLLKSQYPLIQGRKPHICGYHLSIGNSKAASLEGYDE